MSKKKRQRGPLFYFVKEWVRLFFLQQLMLFRCIPYAVSNNFNWVYYLKQ